MTAVESPTRASRAGARWRRELGGLLATEVATFLLTVVVLQLWRARARVPFYSCAAPVGKGGSGCDAVWFAGVTKTVLANGWYFDNSKLGFPTGSNLRDFPTLDLWHALYLNAFSLISHDWALAMNSLYVGSFLLIAAASYCALRGLHVRRAIAAGGAVITAFLPYHLVRNEAHLILADYFVIPLIVMLAVVQLSDRPWFGLRGGWQSSRWRWL